METKNFSYKKNKGNYISTNNSKNNVKNIFNIKKINIIFMIIVFIFISIFPTTKVEAGDKTEKYTQRLVTGIEAFPEDYQKLLRQFVDDTFHDNWTFQAYYTGIDWNDFISGEQGYNRVYKGFDTAHRCTCGSLESGYYCANSEITSYFVDPRNFINERNLFQFLEISYNEELYTRDIVAKLVAKYNVFNKGEYFTFVMSDENHEMYNKEVTMTYTDIIMEAAKKSQMSPISMVIKIVQEVGADGSGSTDGKHSTFPNTYNFFNIGSSDKGDAIYNGLEYANNKGWHCPYTSIVEGAMFNSDNYIKAGQNTAYFYKYDCVGTKILKAGETQEISSYDLYHQYMTNIQDPYSQSASLFSTYTNEDLVDENLNFIIPVFENMPKNPVNKISSLSNSDKDLYYADISSSLYIRTAPKISAKELTSIYKDDLVVMLQRNYTTSGGNSWDKVQIWNGEIGYTMSKYLEPFVPYTEEEPDGENPGDSNNGNNGDNTGGNTGGENGDSGNIGDGTTGGNDNENNNGNNDGNAGEENPGTGDDSSDDNNGGNTDAPDNGSTGDENPGTGGEEDDGAIVGQQPLAHIGYGYADVSTTLNVRKGAGSSYSKIDSLVSKQEFVILEETDNWCKIQYGDKVGYVSKEYVKSLEYVKVDEENKQITVIPNITADVLAGKVGVKVYSVKKGDTEILDKSLGTGYVIKLDDKEYTIVKMGDVNGDGKTNTLDALEALKQDVGLIELKDNYLISMDVNNDNKYNTIDALDLLKFDVGLHNISLNK